MSKEERSRDEWSAAQQGWGHCASSGTPVPPLATGLGRWLIWFVLIIIAPIIVPIYVITVTIMFVLSLPLLIWVALKRRGLGLFIRTYPWFPRELRAYWVPPKTFYTGRLVRFAAHRR